MYYTLSKLYKEIKQGLTLIVNSQKIAWCGKLQMTKSSLGSQSLESVPLSRPLYLQLGDGRGRLLGTGALGVFVLSHHLMRAGTGSRERRHIN